MPVTGNRVADVLLPVMFGSVAGGLGIGGVFVAGSVLLLTGSGLMVRPMLEERRRRRDRRRRDSGEGSPAP